MGYYYTPSSAALWVFGSQKESTLIELPRCFFVRFDNIGVAVVTIFSLHFLSNHVFLRWGGME